MRISARSDYALRGMTALAADQTRPITCDAIAAAQDIPARYLKSVFVDLRRAGLVRSQRGCEGGYWIGRDAATISVADVIRAVDGDFPTVHAEVVKPDAHPADAWSMVSQVVNLMLDSLSLGDLVAGDIPASVASAVSALQPSSALAGPTRI